MKTLTRSTAVLALLTAPACTRPNPAFDVEVAASGESSSESSTTRGEATGGSSSSGQATGEPTSGASGTEGASASTDMSSGTGATSTGATATTGMVSSTGPEATGDMSSGTDGETTGGVSDCWDLEVDAWTLASLELGSTAGTSSLSPDALTLHYRVLKNGNWDFYRTIRQDLDQPFGPGELFFGSPGWAIDYPEHVEPTDELFFTGDGGDIYVVARDGATWGEPDVAGGVKAFGIHTESHGNLTADGATLLFQRDDGQPFGQFTVGYNFYQIHRDPLLHPKFPDNPPQQVTPLDAGFGLAACPALAPDGLHLFFGAVDSEGAGQGDANDGRVGVWYARRDANHDTEWLDITRSAQLREAGRMACPVSVSADGCTMTLAYFKYGANGPYTARIARRG